MKKCIAFLLFFVISFAAVAQQQLVKLWETDSVLRVPESVLFDSNNRVLYVSNIEGKEPWGRDGKGSISKVGLDGKILVSEWITGMNAPKGMALYKGYLYVADLTEILVIDILAGKISNRISIQGAIALNDVTVDKKGKLFVSDSRGRKVFSINSKATEKAAVVILDSNQLKGPNGVLSFKRNLYVLDAGSLYKIGKMQQLVKLADGMEGGTDGVEPVSNDAFIVSTWSGVVYFVNANGKKQVLSDTRPQKINSADIGYDPIKKILYVPTFWKNSVVAYQLK